MPDFGTGIRLATIRETHIRQPAPPAVALHMKDFGLAIFVASVGLEAGPQAMTLLADKGLLLPFLSAMVVLVPLVSSMYYARYVLKMNPAAVRRSGIRPVIPVECLAR